MENAPHLHLLINHLPIFATLLALPVLLLALVRKMDAGLTLAACVLMVAAGVGTGGSLLTGKSAEAEVKQLPGVEGHLIDAHEDAADIAGAMTTLSALAALVVAGLTWKRSNAQAAAVVGLLVLTGISAVLMGRVGQTGGKIRHTEVR